MFVGRHVGALVASCSVLGRIVIVSYTQRKAAYGEAIRIISARRASRKERTAYVLPAAN
jgi:uncharacterized DUF497 family protein